MPKSFFNKFKGGRDIFQPTLLSKTSHSKHKGRGVLDTIKGKNDKSIIKNIGKTFNPKNKKITDKDIGKGAINIQRGMAEATGMASIQRQLGIEPTDEEIAKSTVLTGKIMEEAGTLLGQPELSGLGAGVQAIGEIERGDKDSRLLRNLAINAVSTGAGIGIGQLGGNQTAQIIGSHLVGGALTNMFNKEENKSRNEEDLSHHGQLQNQIEENQHTDDQNTFHNQVQLPSDLQGTNQVSQDVGLKLQGDPNDLAKTEEQFEDDIALMNNGIQMLEFLVNNYNNFEGLDENERGNILEEVIESGLLNNLLDALPTDF